MVERDLSRQFTELVADILRACAFEVEIEPQGPGPGRPDLIIRSPTGPNAVVEAKLYSSWIAPTGPVQQAAAIIEIVRQNLIASKAILCWKPLDGSYAGHSEGTASKSDNVQLGYLNILDR
jgi:hypothetical protein